MQLIIDGGLGGVLPCALGSRSGSGGGRLGCVGRGRRGGRVQVLIG